MLDSAHQAMFHLIALRYILAGDLESDESLSFLQQRIREIDWASPAFQQFTAEMRNGTPELTADLEATFQKSLPAIVHFLTDLLAANCENSARLAPILERNVVDLKYLTLLVEEFIKYTARSSDVFYRATDRLQQLGVNTEEFRLPDYPRVDRLSV